MDWWHEDPELLSATLFLLASDESHQPPPAASPGPDAQANSSTGEDDASESSKPSAKNGRTRRVVNVSRERRRDEARYLRAKVAELESQLSILRHRREQMLRPHRSETGELRSVAVVWEQLATRQVRELKRSELLNAKLKAMLETQVRVAEDLIAAIRKAEEESQRQRDEAEGLISLKRPRERLAIDISQPVSEEDQLARLEGLCSQWEEMFSRSPRFRDGHSMRFLDVKLIEDNGNEVIVDVFGSWALPFAKDRVEDMFWRFYLEESAEDDGHSWAQSVESRDDLIIGVFRALTTIENHRATFDGKYVGKRLRCPQGNMIIATHMYSEPRCLSNLLDDVELHEDSWMRVADSVDVGGPPLSYPLTVVQHARRMYITFGPRHIKREPGVENAESEEGEDDAATRRVGALTEFLMLQVQDEINRGEQCVENMLLDTYGGPSPSREAPKMHLMAGSSFVV